MRGIVFKKLKSNSGESIAETLVAVLIAAFALLMLAGTVNTASNLITSSQSKLEDYYVVNNELAGQGSDSITITISGGANNAVNDSDQVNAAVKSSNIGNKTLVSYR